MNCNECRGKLKEYVEGNLSEVEDQKIKEHLLKCPECNRAYEEEKIEYQIFKDSFEFKDIDFNDSTEKIMSSIDKNRYKSKKSIFYRHRKSIGAIASAVVICCMTVPMVKMISESNTKTSKDTASVLESSMAGRNGEEEIDTDKFAGINTTDSTNKNKADSSDKNEVDKHVNDEKANEEPVKMNVDKSGYYKEIKVDSEDGPNFGTPFIESKDGSFEASLDGRGEYGIEEGKGSIFIINKVDGTKSIFKSEDARTAYSALSISWYDDTHLMIVHGYEYGTLNNGVELIMLDVTTGDQKIIYRADINSGERIIKAYRNDKGGITIEGGHYVDEILNEFKDSAISTDKYTMWDEIEAN